MLCVVERYGIKQLIELNYTVGDVSEVPTETKPTFHCFKDIQNKCLLKMEAFRRINAINVTYSKKNNFQLEHSERELIRG